MCHYCGVNFMMSINGIDHENENRIIPNVGNSVQSCDFCSLNKDLQSVNQEITSSRGMPSISSTASLISSGSSISNCSDTSVDANFSSRGYVDDSNAESSQEDSVSDSKGHLGYSNSSVKLNGFHETGGETIGSGRFQVGRDNNVNTVGSSIDEETEMSDEMDAQFWLPPEPEDQDDDIVDSVANYDDDDDECGEDGARWAKSSSLSCLGEEGSGSYKFKEEKRQAMDEVMNGKLKALVGQLIKSVGVASSGNDGEIWVDIVTSLSWKAAAFVKPHANEGKAMDPDGYVKIKCIATGSRSQSRLIKGCVFKKHAAHKHMPTKYKNPKLMLINDSLDLSSSGLSSFESMQQEKDSLKSILERIEMYNPNVILVEKSVSRGIQESILAKGMTLVFDMKLHRLERVARCTGSPILSSDFASGQGLRLCDSFQIEKFVEEHNVLAEGGKKPSKTLTFLEGCPTRLGCTILLMGANGDELKRIKCVVRCAVIMAYHLMLETSFLLDQRAMFSTIPLNKMVDLALNHRQLLSTDTVNTAVFCQASNSETDSLLPLDIPISDGFDEIRNHNLISLSEGNSSFSFEPYSQATFPGLSLSESLKKVMDDSYPFFSDSFQSMSSQLEFNGRNHGDHVEDEVKKSSSASQLGFDGRSCEDLFKNEMKKSSSAKVMDHYGTMPMIKSEDQNLLSNEESHLPPGCSVESLDILDHSDNAEDQMNSKNEISSVLDSESILVLMSKRNASSGTVCEQSHFSHIKFYRNFDDPLGKFLQENLLKQGLQCKTCGKPPEGHFFYYAHHNKQLSIQVKRLPDGKGLPGETEGKLWMWSRCGQCKFQNGSSKSTKRVLISTDARNLSFGKFLELNFSNLSSFNSPSSCGHSFHKDFLYFFGSGPMVAVFKYSPVATYSVSLPHKMLEFNSLVRGEFLKEDLKKVHVIGTKLFLEIENSLKDLETRYVGVTLNIQGSSKKFSDIKEILKQEKFQFEVDIQNAARNGSRDESAYKLLSLNKLRLELLLELCVWDQRLQSLLSFNLMTNDHKPTDLQVQDQPQFKEDVTDGEETSGADIKVENCDSLENIAGLETNLITSVEANDFTIKEIPIDGQVEESRGHGDSFTIKEIPIDVAGSYLKHQQMTAVLNNLENDKGLIWTPYSVIRREYMDNLQRSCSQKFESLGHPATESVAHKLITNDGSKLHIHPGTDDYIVSNLQQSDFRKFESFSHHAAESVVHKLITDEGSRLHIPLGTDDYIVSDYEDEFSSIIACALTFLKNPLTASEVLFEDARKERMDATSNWPSFSSLDSDGILSSSTNTLESHSSSFNGLDLLESLVSYGADHPQVSMVSKITGKHKYSVVCLYASKFQQLRDRCCPSEVDYIASLSRCRNWDAKGGKSKSFFAKTLDDRFIIKEIKRTEFDSFMKFAPSYFQYMNECYESHNQTCLAKVLGIYQVIIRATKNGKETKHDLLVMENLSFGRNITRQYDLKGALHARFNSAGNGSGDVLLDQNFVDDMNDSPIYISRSSKRHLQRAVWNDTAFLKSINVMDYSLLVGVDSRRRELVCGIIDYLRQYTWDKQLENWVKSSLVPRNQQPTVISPKEYKKRLRKFIDAHFLCVPDHWCSHRLSNPCKLCGAWEENGSLPAKSHERGDHDDESREQPKHEDKSGPSSPNHERNGFTA